MSTRYQLPPATDALRGSLNVEEIVEQPDRAFKLKHGNAPQEPGPSLEPLPVLGGSVPTGWKDTIYDRQ